MICYLPEGESQPLRGLWFVENGWIEDVRPRWGRRNTERMMLQSYNLSEVGIFRINR